MDVSKLEPAERNPAQLRKTALIIVLFAIGGGILIQLAYNNYLKRTANDERLPYKYEIRDNISFVCGPDGKTGSIADIGERIWIALITTSKPTEKSRPSLDAIDWLLHQFENDAEKPIIVAFVLDVDADNPADLAKILPHHGDNIIRVAAGKSQTPLAKYLKTELRFGEIPRLENDTWKYDSNLILIDHQNKVRGWKSGEKNDVGYDFERVARWEKEYAQAKIEKPDKELIPPPLTTDGFRAILEESVRYLIKNK